MKHYFRTLLLVYIGLFLAINLIHCSGTGKIVPEYKGVDPRAQGFVDEYKALAKIQGIAFNHEVIVGFKSINDGNVIGMCNVTPELRWIDLDEGYWENSNYTTHLALIMHELTHCYCDRDHDFGEDNPIQTQAISEAMANPNTPIKRVYPDGCPLSVMFPIVLDNDCVIAHYGSYVAEMFDRCDPY